jgi:hypothetical protein
MLKIQNSSHLPKRAIVFGELEKKTSSSEGVHPVPDPFTLSTSHQNSNLK